jgi:hypothetical protein
MALASENRPGCGQWMEMGIITAKGVPYAKERKEKGAL